VNKKSKKIHFPKTRLSKLVARPGGISYVAAIENAHKNIETMHEQSDEVIIRLIAEIDAIANAPQPEDEFTEADMSAILIRADQIVTLAETFGHELLDTIARSLCDMVDGLLGSGKRDVAPVLVHVQAMDKMAPGKETLCDAEFETILGELSKVRKHFNITSLSDANPDSFEQQELGAE
jgi:hypothetical protein